MIFQKIKRLLFLAEDEKWLVHPAYIYLHWMSKALSLFASFLAANKGELAISAILLGIAWFVHWHENLFDY